jgi:hypothetical protein
LVLKYINIKYFQPWNPQHPQCIFQCPPTLYLMPSIFKVMMPSIAWKKKIFMFSFTPSVFQCAFSTSYYFLLSFCHSLSTFLLFCSFHFLSSMVLCRCVCFVNFDKMFWWIYHFQCWFEYFSNFD